MQISNNQRILFDPVSHSYLLDGEKLLIGLTTLMKKHGLGADYSGISKAVLDNAAAEGTAIHELLQNYDEGNSILSEPLIEEYREAIHNAGLTHIASEFLVTDNEIVATFIDKVYETGIKDTVDLADVKTTSKIHNRALSWQLGVNKVLFERQTGLKVRDVFCIHIDKKTRKLKGLVPVTPVSEQEVDALLNAERSGQIYIDNEEAPTAALVLSQNELSNYVESASQLAQLKAQIKEVESAIKEYDKRILKYMEDNNLTELSAPGGTIKRKAGSVQTRVDSKKLKEEYPHIYGLVAKEVSVSGSIFFKPNE